jgi:hypothetical protein
MVKLKKNNKAQFAMEYVLTIAIVLAISIPAISIAYRETMGKTKELEKNQLQTLAETIVTNSEVVYYHGVPSRVTAQVVIPTDITSIRAGGPDHDHIIFVTQKYGEIAFPGTVPLNFSIAGLGKGKTRLKFDCVYYTLSDGGKKAIVNITKS